MRGALVLRSARVALRVLRFFGVGSPDYKGLAGCNIRTTEYFIARLQPQDCGKNRSAASWVVDSTLTASLVRI